MHTSALFSRRGILAGGAAVLAAQAAASPFRLHVRGKAAGAAPGSFITPGSVVFGVGTWAADTYSTPEGSPGADGYSVAPAGCNWTCQTWQVCTPGNPVTLSGVGAGTLHRFKVAARSWWRSRSV